MTPAFLVAMVFMENWLAPKDNIAVFQYNAVIGHPVFGQAPHSDDSSISSSSKTGSCGSGTACKKKFFLKLDKFLINKDKDEDDPPCFMCELCRRNYASGHLSCCQRPACRECRKQFDGTNCVLCRCMLCLDKPENAQRTPCCNNICCQECVSQATLTTTVCPACKKSICDTPGKPSQCVTCSACNNKVHRKDYEDHKRADHPSSKEHIWDYWFCNLCTLFINPALWLEHNQVHGSNGFRAARNLAQARIIYLSQDYSDEEDPIDDNTLAERICSGNEQEDIMEPEFASPPSNDANIQNPSEVAQIECPVCHSSISNCDMSEHMMQPDHDTSNSPSEWHIYCENLQMYIRQDLYDLQYH